MTVTQAVVLGTIQGLTEFLPVSSSAHLYAVPTLLGWSYAGIGFDVALHWGTLAALLLAFGSTWLALARDVFAADPAVRAEARTTWLKLIVASVPAALAGLALHDVAETWLRSLPLQAVMLFVFGFLLWWVDRIRPQNPTGLAPDWRTSMFIGLAQVLSLVPGVSRSGVTITAGRAAAVERAAAARFSFLLATPITFGAGLVALRDLHSDLSPRVVLAGIVTAAIVGWVAIRGLMRWVQRAGFAGFFAYRALFAAFILIQVARHEPESLRTVSAGHLVRKIAVQAVAQEDARAVQPRLHRRHRQVEDLGDLGVRKPLDVTQDEHRSELFW